MHRRPMPPLRTPSPLHVPRGRRPPPYTGCGHAAGRQLWSTRQTRRVPIGVHGPSDRRGGTMPFGTSGAGMGMKRPSTGLKANQQHSRPGSLPIRNQMETCSCRMAQDAKKALTGFEEGVVERRSPLPSLTADTIRHRGYAPTFHGRGTASPRPHCRAPKTAQALSSRPVFP